MNELIKIENKEINNEAVQTVCARDLHAFLESKRQFADWIKAKLERLRLIENKDFVSISQTCEKPSGGRPTSEYFITLDTAKHIAMMENTDRGFEVRDYFIECEKQQAKALKAISTVNLDLSSNLVVYKDDDFYLSSLSIAKELDKRHSNILRDIEQEVSQLKSESADFSPILEGFKEITYLDEQGKPRKAYELNEIASYQMLLRYSPKCRAMFLLQFKQMKDTILNMFKLKVIDSVLPEYKGKRSYIYIIKNLDSNNLKVGVGSDPLKRLKQLQTGSDSELSLVYTSFLCSNAFSLENDIHNRFKESHVRGEWFKMSEKEVINYLEKQKYVLSSELDLSFDSKLIEMMESRYE